MADRDLIGMHTLPELPRLKSSDRVPLKSEYEFLVEYGSIPSAIDWEQVAAGFKNEVIAYILERREQFSLETYDYDRRSSRDVENR